MNNFNLSTKEWLSSSPLDKIKSNRSWPKFWLSWIHELIFADSYFSIYLQPYIYYENNLHPNSHLTSSHLRPLDSRYSPAWCHSESRYPSGSKRKYQSNRGSNHRCKLIISRPGGQNSKRHLLCDAY